MYRKRQDIISKFRMSNEKTGVSKIRKAPFYFDRMAKTYSRANTRVINCMLTKYKYMVGTPDNMAV